ncbi:glutathione synthase [Wenzhouxiangella sp. XN79A]|uniref:glutathione synthase n=1 Tax=Wenzhouxiangella sp. XN79A TaxID=2724193 RepID=UPI00144A5EE5|nr:glutathione synthase [Wenzhouxiangella sp. XN79A]NKI35659.1 glutathione synthase [Wenzhouxiangella sp. XN79A]
MNQAVFVMDALEAIKPVKDTTFALMLEAQRRGLPVWYANERDLTLDGGRCTARLRRVELVDRADDFFAVVEETHRPLGADDLVFMRSDPPVDDTYIYATLLLDRVVAAGGRVINRPDALRGFNEKLAIARFPEWIPDTLVSADMQALRGFVEARERAVIKPLDGMGGHSIFVVSSSDPNLSVILETLTDQGRKLAMIQQYLPGIADGDKRILLVAGEPVPYMLARIPGEKDFRGNLARGGRGEGRPLTAAERAIAEVVGPVLVEHGIDFAGLDVIDGKLTEINVTSPTCVRELDAQFGINIAGQLFDALER